MVSAYDFYDTAKKIAKNLSETGLSDWSDRITGAIAAGFTSGEILGAIRWELKELLKSKPVLPKSLELAISNLIAGIDEAFKQVE